jgi:hypothetical protein
MSLSTIASASPIEPELQPSTVGSLVDLLTCRYAPVQTVLIALLDVTDVIALKKTNKALYVEMADYQKNIDYNINQKLRSFFQDPKAFRSVQARCDALLWGSLGKNFLSRRRRSETRIAITLNEDLPLMCTYLKSDGYIKQLQPDPQNDQTPRLTALT